jgi:excinuclease ABC subunit A
VSVRGARVNNLKNLDVEIPLNQLVGIAGVSGSGKSSLALGVLYAEGSRRYIEALSTYTRRRMTQSTRAAVDSVEHVPAALALRQRPGVPGVRSTFGTSTELLNVVRLMFSRLASHICPNGHTVPPTINVAAERPVECPVCQAPVTVPGAEDLAFNSDGACPRCDGTGTIRTVDDRTLVPDTTKTIDDGAVVPWNMFGFNVQPDIVREFGVRTDVPWSELTDNEKDIVFTGPEEKKHITVTSMKGVHDLDFTFRNARLTVTKELERADTEKRLKRVDRFLSTGTCPDCAGTRLSEPARLPRISSTTGAESLTPDQTTAQTTFNLAEVTSFSLDDVLAWASGISDTLPEEMRPMADGLVGTLHSMARRLLELGLSYLSLDRAGSTLSTGERQRVQLARAVRNRTTGVLYVLDEPSIGLHPANVDGLLGVMEDLLSDGNSVVFVDHDVQVLRQAEHLVEVGPGSGRTGGTIVATGTVDDLVSGGHSRLAGFLTGDEDVRVRGRVTDSEIFELGRIHMETGSIHTVHPLSVDVPVGRLTAVTGMSGSGKTTMVLESLVPAVNGDVPDHVSAVDAPEGTKVHVVDATPIGINVRSTVATYSGVMDDLRNAFAATDSADRDGLTASDFSYNTSSRSTSLACPRCEGTGRVSLDVQFLPDVDIPCPDCDGTRYAPQAAQYRINGTSLPDLMQLSIVEALDTTTITDLPRARRKLMAFAELGLGYLTLGEATPELSGGEAQRLKLVNELHRNHRSAVFVLDEPSVGLHPLDVRTLLEVLQRLCDQGATVLVIEHDLDMIANADHIIDMGPGGGEDGGRIVAVGTPDEIAGEDVPDSDAVSDSASVTGRYLRDHLYGKNHDNHRSR